MLSNVNLVDYIRFYYKCFYIEYSKGMYFKSTLIIKINTYNTTKHTTKTSRD